MAFANATDSPDFAPGPGIGTGLLLNLPGTVVPGLSTAFFPAANNGFYVGSASAMYLSMVQNTTQQGTFKVAFYADQAATQIVSSAFYNRGLTNQMVDIIPIAGPFVVFSYQNGAGGNQTIQWTVELLASSPTGASVSSMLAPNDRVLAIGNNLALPASASIFVNASAFVPGPASWWFQSSELGTALLQVQGGGNTGSYIAGGQEALNGGVQSFMSRISLPNDDWRLQIFNSTQVAATAYTAVTSER